MSTPRIDGVRNELDLAVKTLQLVRDNLEDLHVLAYDRATAKNALELASHTRKAGYSLDTHGILEARRLYSQVLFDVRRFIANCLGSADEMRDFLNNLKPFDPTVTPRDKRGDADTTEIAEALDAQSRRLLGGMHTPARLVAQPGVIGQDDWQQVDWQRECNALRSAVRKVTAAFAADHTDCELPPDPRRGWKRPKARRRYQTSLLTPREREAWHRSVSDPAAEKVS